MSWFWYTPYNRSHNVASRLTSECAGSVMPRSALSSGVVWCVGADWGLAEQSYTQALRLCPRRFSQERAVLFSNRAAARLHLVNATHANALTPADGLR